MGCTAAGRGSGWGEAYLVAKNGVQNATGPVVLDIDATPVAAIPQDLVLPRPCRCGEAEVAKPAHTLKGNHGSTHQPCRIRSGCSAGGLHQTCMEAGVS